MFKDDDIKVPNAKNQIVLQEIIDDRSSGKAFVFTSQLPIAHCHDLIVDSKILEAILTGP